MFLFEKVNFEIVQKLKLLTYAQFVQIFEKSTTKRHNDYDLRSEFTKIKNYAKDSVKSNNNLKVEYGFVDGKDFGRLQSKTPSIQRLYNGFRGLLCDGITYDLDINNCHPNILMNLCKKHKIPYDNIKRYIENREPYLKAVMDELKISRSEAKALYLKCINKEGETTKFNKKPIKNTDFLEFDRETTNIINSLYDIYKKEFFEYVKDKEYNQKGKLVNLLLCKIENEYLNKALDYLKSKNIEVCTLMFDGCMIYKGEYDIKTIIKDLDKLFKKDNITWSFKEHNTELLKDLNALKLKEIDYYCADNIIELAEYILNNTLNDRIFRYNGIIYLITNNKLTSNQNDIKSYLYSKFSESEYYIKEGDKDKLISKNHSQLNNLVESVINKVETSEKDFLKEIWNETQFKLFYKNGYYDFKQNKFIKSSYGKTFIRIEKEFDNNSNESIRNEIYNKILYPIFSIHNKEDSVNIQLMNNFLYNISRAIAGNIEDKQWLLMQGLRDCGKGVISALLKECFEQYIEFTNIGNFISKNLNTDSAKALSWMLDYQFKRLAITQEISLADKQEIDGSLIKKFCSGGDYLQARKNNKDEVEFKIQSSLMICCNDFPEISPTDTMEFCREYQIKSKFVNDDFPEEKKLNTFSYFKADPLIKEFIKRPEVVQEFTLIIMEAYKNKVEYPKQIKQELEANEEEEDTQKLFNLFEFTNDKTDYISNDDLKDALKNHKIIYAIKKCKILLKTRGAQDYRTGSVRGLNFIKFK
jgi:hypothetical protein